MFKNINLSQIVSIVVISLFIGVVFVYANWSSPPASPPTCPFTNSACNAPINASEAIQYKSGALGIGGVFQVFGDAVFSGGIRLTGNANIKYGTLSDWRLVYRDDFENAAPGNIFITQQQSFGWTNGVGSNMPILVSKCGEAHKILGGYLLFGNGAVQKIFDLSGIPHSEVMVKFTYYFGDSWDGEWAYAWLNGKTIFNRSRDWNISPIRTDICGSSSSYADEIQSVEGIISSSVSTVSVKMGSTLNQAASDEWWGIDNVEIWVR